MNEDQLVDVVDRLWGVLVAAGTTNVESMAILGMFQVRILTQHVTRTQELST